jgi:eukaryotic-like serine/threonine-protein kinase
MSLEPGSKLGPYEILASIAADASVSYKATDTRVNRTVMVKAYPPNVSQNAELKQRIERDLKTISALKHPRICALYEVLHQGEDDYLVTEYVEGESLAERLKRGPMALEEALQTAITIADALDKAHRQGVLHRGLNPSNVILTDDGAKLADFGVSGTNASPATPVPASMLSTRTSTSPTALSAPPSAVPYLAPEQLEGTEPDARTDIFAFGAVLYEMLTGRPAFEGKSLPMLLAAIQTVDPEPLTKLQPAAPPALDYVVKQCLAKDPRQRFQTARDLMSHLQWISQSSARSGLPYAGTRQKKRDQLLWVAAAVAALFAVSMAPAAYRYFGAVPALGEARFVASLPGTGAPAGGTPVVVSPDGRWIAAARLGNSAWGVYLLPLGSVTPKLLLEGRPIFALFWSPDSHSFAFFDEGKLKSSDVSGSPPQTLADAPFPVGGGTWSKDGVIVFSSGGLLHRVQAAGGEPVQITTLDTSLQETEHVAPYFLPDGRHYLYLAASSQTNNSAVYLGSLDSKERTRLLTSEAPAIYAAPGYLLFNRGSAVFAQPFDEKALKLTGEAVRLSDAALRLGNSVAPTQLGPSEGKMGNISVSETGVLAYRNAASALAATAQSQGGLVLTWFDRNIQGTEQVEAPGPYAGVDLAPDGKRFAVHKHESDGGDSWFYDSGRLQRLTFNTAQDNVMPVWSHDGTKIAFASKRNGKWGLYVKASDGTGKEDLILESELLKMPMSWSPDSKLLVYWIDDPKTKGDLWMIPVDGDRKPVALVLTPANETHAQVSPDGKWMAYQSDETGTDQIYVRPFPEGSGNKSQVSQEGGNPGLWPRWRGDGKELYFVLNPNLMAVEIRVNGTSVQPAVPHAVFPLLGNPVVNAHSIAYHVYAVTADGKRFLFPQPQTAAAAAGGLAGAIIAVIDQNTGPAPASNPDSVNVVLNWTRDLKRK